MSLSLLHRESPLTFTETSFGSNDQTLKFLVSEDPEKVVA
jgi:hypothetical protein